MDQKIRKGKNLIIFFMKSRNMQNKNGKLKDKKLFKKNSKQNKFVLTK